MKKIRKIVITTIFSVMLGFTGVFLASCGSNQIDAKITASDEEFDIEVGKEKTISFTVTDFVYDGSVSLSVFDSVITGGEKGHISYNVDYLGAGVTNVTVTGISGGTSTLVATAKEGGNKTASIKINVKGYSDELVLKDEKIYLSENTNLNPSADNFIFSDSTTEKNLKFYFITNKDKISTKEIIYSPTILDGEYLFLQEGGESLKAKKFKSAELDKQNKKIIFTQAAVSDEDNTFEVGVNDTEINYFIAEYENLTSGKMVYKIVDFTTLMGIDKNIFEICDSNGQAKENSTIVTYSTESLGRDLIKVKVPYFSNDTIVYDYRLDNTKLSLNQLSKLDTLSSREYNYQLVSKVAYKTTAKIEFNVYYKGFYGVEDEAVFLRKTLDVDILVEPKEMRVNDVKNEQSLQYTFYNSSVGDYGWKPFNIEVVAEDSSYTGVLVEFDSTLVDIKQGQENLWSGRIITDLSKPLMIRGKNSAPVGSGENYNVKLTLQSKVFEISGRNVSFIIPFEIKEGATKLSFEKESYNYSTTNPDNGIFVSNINNEVLFDGIYANQDFDGAYIEYQDEDRFAEITFVGKEQRADKYNIKLNIKPIKPGNQTVRIILDNGRAILATFRIVKTFDDINVYQKTTSESNNEGTILAENQQSNVMNVIIRNSSGEDNQYDKAVTIQIATSSGLDVIKNIQYESKNTPGNQVFKVQKNGEEISGDYTLKTTTYGNEKIVFTASGISVEDFCLETIERDVTINLISYNPISGLVVKDSEGNLASSLTLYADASAGENQFETLNINVFGQTPFNFYQYYDSYYERGSYLEEGYNDKFIYWTSNQQIFTTANEKVNRMIYGKEYLIGASINDIWATFNTTTKTLSAVSGKTNKSFMLFANLRQYQLTKVYSISVETKQYQSVEVLEEIINENYYTENIEKNAKQINFKPDLKNISFVVNVSPKDATNLEIASVITNEISSVKILDQVNISSISEGSWLVTLKLNEAVLNTNESVGCSLRIAAKDWVNSNGSIKAEFEAKALRYEIAFANGSYENPFILTKASDILTIGESVNGMSAHYKILNTIDMSAYSSMLPLGSDVTTLEGKGVFIGSIRGENTAKITGLNVTNIRNGYAGLFAILGSNSSIENITFEGRIDIETSTAVTAGLVVGENRGTLKNVAVILNASNAIIAGESNLGVVAGLNNGYIQKECQDAKNVKITAFMKDRFTVETTGGGSFIGGIAGKNIGEISDKTRQGIKETLTFGYSGYMSYSLFNVKSNYETYVGGVSGSNEDNIYGMLIGGDIESKSENVYVAAVTGQLVENSKIGENDSSIIIRTKLRGYEVGLVTANKISGNIESEIKVEAIDDGVSINEQASMVVKYKIDNIEKSLFNCIDDDFSNDDEAITVLRSNALNVFNENEIDEEKVNSYINGYIAFNKSNAFELNVINGISFNTYVSRSVRDLSEDFTDETDDYFGDYLIYELPTVIKPQGDKLAQKFFEKISAGGGATIEAKEGFVELKTLDSSDPKMFMVYYFEAEATILDGIRSTANLDEMQLKLDERLNVLTLSSDRWPFTLSDGPFTLTSESPLVVIDSQGLIYLKGKGLAKLVITNTLDARLKEVVYLDIVNYFNHSSVVLQNQSFFKIGESRLSADGENNFSIFPNSNTIIEIEPVILTYKDGVKTIYEDATYMVDNKIVYLVRNKDVLIDIEIPSDSDFNKHSVYENSNHKIIFSKKSGVQTNANTLDEVILKTSFSVNIDEKIYRYVYNCGTVENPKYTTISFRYLQGLTKINNNYDSLVATTSRSATDRVSFVSDAEEDLVIEVYDDFGNRVDGLFNIEKKQIDSDYKWDITISLNKNSELYTATSFGEYKIKYMGTTNNKSQFREIPLMLIDDNLEGVVIDNYQSLNVSAPSDKVVPGKYGYLSMSISPKDLGFTSFEIVNNSTNYTQESTSANFEFGYKDSDTNVFSPIKSTVISGGISISRETLLSIPNFDGQFFVRYIFTNNSNVKDGMSVSLTATLRIPNSENYVEVLDYTIYKEFEFNVTIDGKTRYEDNGNNYYVARGVRYKLNIENTGYDANSIVITTSNNTLADVEKEGEDYYLVVYEREDLEEIELIATASRIDAEGNMLPVSSNSICQIMNYVINWNPSTSDPCYDVVSGVDEGNIAVALGQRKNLLVDFGGGKYIEYNPTIPGVLESLQNLFTDATENGNWRIYSDLKADAPLIPDNFRTSTIDESKYQVDTLSKSKEFSNKYLSVDGFSYFTNLKHEPNNARHYIFVYQAKFKPEIESGTYICCSDGEVDVYSEFSLISYISGAEDHPIPVTSYDDLKNNMASGGYYILTRDLYVTPESFEPISTNIAMLDGNGHSIIFEAGRYDVSLYSQIGLFTSIERGTVVKNLKIILGKESDLTNSKVSFVTTENNSTIFGLVAARNLGSITNVRVENGMANLEVLYNSTSTPQIGCVVAGIAANNSGYITNSQVLASIKTNVSLGGLVGTNTGVVASSYYKDGVLTNISNDNTKFYTAGLVVHNTESGKILTSYTSGRVGSEYIYSYQTNLSKIVSTVQTAGFVYSNLGTITDCYSNIPLDTSASCTGYVYKNSGKIKNCFTTSIIIHDHSQNNYYFVAENVIDGSRGTFENCYYLKDAEAKYKIEISEKTGINQSLATETFEGIRELSVSGFNNLSNFTSFAYGVSQNNYNNVWIFINSGETVTNNAFKKTLVTADNNTGKLKSVEYQDQIFAGGRLELVSANILAMSFEEVSGEETDERGITTYSYTKGLVNGCGDILNPYVVSDPQQFEKDLTANGNKKISSSYFRFISNIDYKELNRISSHLVTFSGLIEGNGMMIQNIDISGSEVIENAGWLGRIDGGNRVCGVTNLIIVPKSVNFPNAVIVGTLAGSIKNATIENVDVISSVVSTETEETNSVTVSGRNFVGGVAGFVGDNTKVKNVLSRVGAKASHISSEVLIENGVYSNSVSNKKIYSYAGGLFGYVYSAAINVSISDITYAGRDPYVIGGRAGFLFGGISANVFAENILLTINANMLINAYKFGGLVVGENNGSIDNVRINGINSSNSKFAVFSVDNYRPIAVGGIVGLMIGGKISNVYQGQSIYIKDTGKDTIGYVGGAVGMVNKFNSNTSATLENIIINGDILARNVVGGVVGYVATSVIMNNIAIWERQFKVTGHLATSNIGGFVGVADDKVKIFNAYSWANIEVECYVINTTITTNISAIIGKVNDVTFDLGNIYTTTTYKVTLEDKRVDGDVKEVKYEQGILPNNVKFNLTCNNLVSQSSSVFNFLGTNAEAANNVLSLTTKFFTKFDLNGVNLNQNEQGVRIAAYVGGQSPIPELDSFYAIMNGKTGWITLADKLPQLEFENSLAI